MCKLIVTAALFVGRIDTPFLADGVGRLLGSVELDNYPNIMLKDILSHEAHRHPYIELLGVMYLMKLRYGKNFGQRAGSTWRLIFVCALFPFLNKYRILEKNELPDEVEDDLELAVRDADMDEGAFEAVLPFERAHVADQFDQGVTEQSEKDPDNKRPSHLMAKYQSLRSTYKDAGCEPQSSVAKQPTQRGSSLRSSQRTSLTDVQELDIAQQVELQQRNSELQREVERLREELDARKKNEAEGKQDGD